MPGTYPNCSGAAVKGFIYDLGHQDMTLNPFDHDEDVIIGQEHCGNRGRRVGDVLIGGVMMVRLRDGAIRALTDPTNEAYPYHVSTRNYDRPGWAYVSYWPAPGRRFSRSALRGRRTTYPPPCEKRGSRETFRAEARCWKSASRVRKSFWRNLRPACLRYDDPTSSATNLSRRSRK